MGQLLSKQEISRSPLYRPAFLRLWSGLMLSRMGDSLTQVALLWFVLQLTHSGVALGLVVLCFQLPSVLSSPLLGTLLDQYEPRVIMVVDNVVRGCIIAAIPLLFLFGTLHLWMVYGLALCAGILSPATEVGLRIITPKLVADTELERANSLLAISWDFATLVGPALAGVLIVFLNAPVVLFIDAVSFLVMGIALLALPRMQRIHQDEAQGNKRFGSFLRFGLLFNMKQVLFLSILTLLFLFVQGLTEVVIPIYSQKTLISGSTGYGLLMTAFSIGSLLSLTFISHFWTRSRRPGITLALILILSGLTLIPLLFIHTLPLALIVMVLVGLAAAPYYVVEQSITQRLIPEHVRGQIFGIRGSMNVAGYPLGGLAGGMFVSMIGVSYAFGIAVVLCLGMGIVCLTSPFTREIRRTQSG